VINKIQLYWNTIRYLRFSQVWYRVFRYAYSIRKKSPSGFTAPSVFIPALDGNKSYLQRFDVERLMKCEIKLLHEQHYLDTNTWTISGNARHLWLYNLQYLEFLIPLALEYKTTNNEKYYRQIKMYLDTWITCNKKKEGDAWASYTISMRIPNLFIVMNILGKTLEKDTPFYRRLIESIWDQYCHLEHNLERHLLGNHYLENIKCLVLCCYAFSIDAKKYERLLLKQLKEQISVDGMHFERSFMYHKIVLEDVLRICYAVRMNSTKSEFFHEISKYIRKMGRTVYVYENGLSRTLLFNDAANNVSKNSAAYIAVLDDLIGEQYKNDIDTQCKTGYFKYTVLDGDGVFVVDCDKIGPDYIPGHGQCDCLSYEFFWHGEPVIVNLGTYQYQDLLRTYFRETKSHNTFLINDSEQSQCWGEHRVAKRINNVYAKKSINTFEGYFTDYSGKKGKRRIVFSQKQIEVRDSCESNGRNIITSWIHFSPEWRIEKIEECIYKELQKSIEEQGV